MDKDKHGYIKKQKALNKKDEDTYDEHEADKDKNEDLEIKKEKRDNLNKG